MFVTCDTRRCGPRDAAWHRAGRPGSHWLSADYKLLSRNKPFKSTHLEAVIFSGQITSKNDFNEDLLLSSHSSVALNQRKILNEKRELDLFSFPAVDHPPINDPFSRQYWGFKELSRQVLDPEGMLNLCQCSEESQISDQLGQTRLISLDRTISRYNQRV